MNNMNIKIKNIKQLLAVARGEQPPQLLLKNGQVIDVFNCRVFKGNVAVNNGIIAAVGSEYKTGLKEIDLDGGFIAPGLIDAHLHVESTLLLPPELGRVILGHGTTAVIHDPHEIANVLGLDGVKLMLDLSESSPCDFFATVPSSVPSTDLETAGGEINADQVAQLLRHPRVVGLGEMMNYPGVINGNEEMLRKIIAAQSAGKVVDGHAPSVRGSDLQAYLAAGVSTDHECITPAEAQEKLNSGMKIIIRHGSATSSLDQMLSLINPSNSDFFMFGSDDREVGELLEKGHVNEILKKAVSQGGDPLVMIKIASLNPARHYRLYERGAIAPGYRADLVVFEDLKNFQTRLVFKDGLEVFREGRMLISDHKKKLPAAALNSVKLAKPLQSADFNLYPPSDQMPVIGVIPGQLITEKLFYNVKRRDDGSVPAVPAPGINKIAVVERHGKNGRISVALIKGIGLNKGALASSVAHDSHNILVTGACEKAMAAAVNELARVGGGFVVVGEDAEVKACLPLKAGGLMSVEKAETVAKKMNDLLTAAHELGTDLSQPFLTLSFMALPVIPSLKITDRGLVDVDNSTII